MTPGDLILVTRAVYAGKRWHPGVVVSSKYPTQIVEGTVLLLLSVNATMIMGLFDAHGIVPLYVLDWDGHPSFEVLR